MKSFLEILEEAEKSAKPVVMAFGRMNPPTTGHLKLIDKVKSTAEKLGAKHTVVVSHSQDSKKNPLSGEQKIKHLKRYSSGTNFQSSSSQHPTILHHAAKLHGMGHDELHVIAGSDRVKEMEHLLHKYNGVKGKHGYYNFKKIRVHSAGHRDPDAEGAEGMSGTKMREHAKNNDFSSFRQGVPHHVSAEHAKELMHDVRKGMGLNESYNRGMFKAIFITGGPGSGKDVIIREAIASEKATELNFTQVLDILNDKHKLAMKSMNPKFESVRTRNPLIINGPADDLEKINRIKEELEEIGYSTMMIFVNTDNKTSQERNSSLSRVMVESIRQEKWCKSQENTKYFTELFNNFINFDNTGNLDNKEEDITEIYQTTQNFLDSTKVDMVVDNWLSKTIKEENVKKTNAKAIQLKTVGKYNPSFRAKGPADIKRDNSGSLVYGKDQISGDTGPRKDPNGRGHSGGAWSGVYNTSYNTEEKGPTIKFNPPAKEPNFNYDKDKLKKQKKGDKSLSAGRVARPDGVTPTYDTRAGGQGAAAGAGLGNQTYSETVDYNNDDVSNFSAQSGSVQANPLSSAYEQKKSFDRFRKKIKKEAIDHHTVDMGVSGTLSGAGNKQGMDSYFDQQRNIGVQIKRKVNKKFNQSKDDGKDGQ